MLKHLYLIAFEIFLAIACAAASEVGIFQDIGEAVPADSQGWFLWASLIFVGFSLHHISFLLWRGAVSWLGKRKAKAAQRYRPDILEETETHVSTDSVSTSVGVNMNMKGLTQLYWVGATAFLHMEPANFDGVAHVSEILSDCDGLTWEYLNFDSSGSAVLLKLSGWKPGSRLFVEIRPESSALFERRHNGSVGIASTRVLAEKEEIRREQLREAAKNWSRTYLRKNLRYRLRKLVSRGS